MGNEIIRPDVRIGVTTNGEVVVRKPDGRKVVLQYDSLEDEPQKALSPRVVKHLVSLAVTASLFAGGYALSTFGEKIWQHDNGPEDISSIYNFFAK